MKAESGRNPERPVSEDVMDIHQAAWFVGAHVETLRRLARKGEIPAYKLGKDWRFRKEALVRWMDSHHERQQASLVLVADDERSVRVVCGEYLESSGYRVLLAESGEQAVEFARREPPNLLLLDLMMSGMSGVDALKAVRAIVTDIPVIVITGYPDSVLMAEALRHPPVTLLPKPVDKRTLLKTVRMVLCGAGGAE